MGKLSFIKKEMESWMIEMDHNTEDGKIKACSMSENRKKGRSFGV